MKLNPTISTDTFRQFGAAASRLIGYYPGNVLLRHQVVLAWLIVVAGFIAALVVVFMMLFFHPATDAVLRGIQPTQVELETDTIDRLEFWIEEVQLERNSGAVLPSRGIFVIGG